MRSGISQFDFSIIIPIYNTEDYLEEAIESIINQSIGFKQHIQLILVNDGSTDHSEEVCLKYQRQYPDNIIYKYKENGGASSACNTGLDLATGTYVNCFGSDDIWSKDTFKLAYKFFCSEAGKQVDLISFKLHQFGKVDRDHILNYKYEETKVVDLTEDYDFIQLMNGNCIIRRDAIGDLRYDTSVEYMEDALFVNEIILKKCKYGVLKDGCYYNRRREDDSNVSAFTGEKAKERFLIAPQKAYSNLFDLSRRIRGKIERFIQFSIAYEMQWRMCSLPCEFTSEELKEYRQLLVNTLQDIEDIIILKQKNLTFPKRVFMYQLKHGEDFFPRIEYREGAFYNDDGEKVLHLKGNKRCFLNIVERVGESLVLKGVTDLFSLGVPFELYAKNINGDIIIPEINDFPPREVKGFDDTVILQGNIVVFRLPLKKGERYSFFLRVNGEEMKISPLYGVFGKLDHNLKHSYWRTKDYLIKLIKGTLYCNNYSERSHIASELRLLRDIVTSEYKDKWKKVFARLGYYFVCMFFRGKELWLISDRDYHATDSGSAFFKYASKHIDKKIKMYFVLDKTSRDYHELRSYGKIVNPFSYKHKLLLLRSNKILSAYSEQVIIQPFSGQVHLLAGLFNYKYVYLQHGVMQGNLEHLLNVLNKNIKLLPTSTKMETESILSGSYGYDQEIVQLLGLTRFDLYYQFEKKKKIVFLPTWREALAGSIIPHTRERRKVEGFKDTEYCRFYNKLINNPRLISAMKQYGYSGEFYLHPSFAKQKDDFEGNETIPVMETEASYAKVLGESSLLITDYSGVQFDFAYLRKPIVYSQFDSINDGDAHSYNYLFFDYDKQAFGPLAHTVDDTVNCIINALQNDCILDEQYQKRVDDFFSFDDNLNCQRVYEAVLQL